MTNSKRIASPLGAAHLRDTFGSPQRISRQLERSCQNVLE
jgi:hypothetical protein